MSEEKILNGHLHQNYITQTKKVRRILEDF